MEGLRISGTGVVDCLSPSATELVVGVFVVTILEDVDDWTLPPLVIKLLGEVGLGAPD